MEKAGLWNIHQAVYIGPGVVRAAIIRGFRGNRSGVMGPGLSGSGPQQRLNELSVEPATNMAHTQLSS